MVVRYYENTPSGFKVFVGCIIHSRSLKDLEILPHASLGVRPDGTIAFLRPHTDPDEALSFIEEASRHDDFVKPQVHILKASQFLFPGMIDCHLHAPQWPNLALGMAGTLQDWCENWTDPMEASYSDNDKARRVYADVTSTTLKLGSTTVAYNSSIHVEATNILADAALEAGQRAIIGKMSITVGSTHGNKEESIEVSLRDSQRSVDYIRNLGSDRIFSCIMPRGGPYAPPDLMAGLGEQCKRYKTYVQAHMCETHSDINRMREMHPGFESYSEMYKSYGLLNERSILAHCIWLLPTDIENIKSTNAGIAHNPNSNTCLRDGECRVRELLDEGIKIGLGTDCSAGYMPSIHDAMKQASNVSRHLAMKMGDDRHVLGFNELVYLATMGGAKVVGMEDNIGNFEVGKKFDALLVDAEGVISADKSLWDGDRSKVDGEAMVKKWVFMGDDRNIRQVFVDGKLVSGSDMTGH